MSGIEPFDRYSTEYDRWFDEQRQIYQVEVDTLRRLIPAGGTGVEIGAGTGRFARPLGAELGIEPSRPMAKIACERGLCTVQAVGERLPIRAGCYDYALLVTVVCFVADVPALFRETWRVLKPDGRIIVGLIDSDSSLGRLYESRREFDPFYRYARFYNATDILGMLEQTGFCHPSAYQAMIDLPGEASNDGLAIRPGYGAGAFIGIGAGKALTPSRA